MIIKPKFGARIDWKHPLSRGLVLCAFPGWQNQMDLVSRQLGVLSGTGTWEEANNQGQAYRSDSITGTELYFPFDPIQQSITNKCSFVVKIGRAHV